MASQLFAHVRPKGVGKEIYMELTRLSRLVLAVNGIALDVVEVPGLVQGAAVAADGGLLAAMQLSQGSLNLRELVGLGLIGFDASIGEGLRWGSASLIFLVSLWLLWD